MAFDEIFVQQLTLVQTLLTGAFTRWRDAANAARSNTFTIDDLFEVGRSQFVENWDTWNKVMVLPIQERLPTVMLGGTWNNLYDVNNPKQAASGTAMVSARLTSPNFNQAPLVLITGGNQQIGPNDYTVDVTGDFDGTVKVTMKNNAPQQPAAGTNDVYVGPILVKLTGEVDFHPVAWIAVVAEP
jgi:hypothetical protein